MQSTSSSAVSIAERHTQNAMAAYCKVSAYNLVTGMFVLRVMFTCMVVAVLLRGGLRPAVSTQVADATTTQKKLLINVHEFTPGAFGDL